MSLQSNEQQLEEVVVRRNFSEFFTMRTTKGSATRNETILCVLLCLILSANCISASVRQYAEEAEAQVDSASYLLSLNDLCLLRPVHCAGKCQG